MFLKTHFNYTFVCGKFKNHEKSCIFMKVEKQKLDIKRLNNIN